MVQVIAGENDKKWFTSHITDLIKFLSSVKGDLANVSAPPLFLASSSVTEVGHCWAQKPAVFTAPAREKDPKRRSLLVLQLVLTALRSQVYIGGAPGISIKKPLNAFLGELFLASWSDEKDGSKTRLVAEQVSHHPPVTAMHVANEEEGIRADGYARVEMTFSKAVNIRQIGHATLHIDEFDEDYIIPFPDVQVRGYLSACLYPEILGKYTIPSSNGYVSEMNFFGSGFLGGKRNAFEARVYHKDDPKTSIYKICGSWSDKWEIKDGKTGEVLEIYNYEAEENRPAPMEIDPIDTQDPWESRRAWGQVISGLSNGELGSASAAKGRLEEAQRRMRAKEKQSGFKWEPLFFEPLPGDQHPVFDRLTKGTAWKLGVEQTKGVWRLNQERLQNTAKPYRGNLTPAG